jgi:hypothetical protein
MKSGKFFRTAAGVETIGRRSEQSRRLKMKTLLAVTTVLLAASPAWGHSLETAIIAAMKLSEVPNYSWNCAVTDDAQSYQIEGKTELGGYTWQRQPMPKKIARRLGRSAGRELEAIFSRRLRYVIQTESGWKALDELPKQHEDWTEDQWIHVSTTPVVRTPDMPADASIDPFGLPPAVYIPVLPKEESDNGKAYSNAQFALALPHEELGVIVSSHVDFQVEGNTASGTLTDIGAQLLLVHDGHEYIKPVAGGGASRFGLVAVWWKNTSLSLPASWWWTGRRFTSGRNPSRRSRTSAKHPSWCQPMRGEGCNRMGREGRTELISSAGGCERQRVDCVPLCTFHSLTLVSYDLFRNDDRNS